MANSCQVEVGYRENGVYFRIRGYASFVEAAEITKYLEQSSQMIQSHHFAFDLRECEKMDSTFMGLIAKLACESTQQSRLEVYHCQGSALKCLEDLGLTLIVKMCDQWQGEPVEFTPLGQTEVLKQDKESVIRSSHETLSSLNEENKKLFSDVIESFKSDQN